MWSIYYFNQNICSTVEWHILRQFDRVGEEKHCNSAQEHGTRRYVKLWYFCNIHFYYLVKQFLLVQALPIILNRVGLGTAWGRCQGWLTMGAVVSALGKRRWTWETNKKMFKTWVIVEFFCNNDFVREKAVNVVVVSVSHQTVRVKAINKMRLFLQWSLGHWKILACVWCLKITPAAAVALFSAMQLAQSL